MAAHIDLHVDKGSDKRFVVVPRDAADRKIDLTGYKARMQIRKTMNSPEVIDTLTTENGGLAIVDGVLVIHFKNEQTEDYDFFTALYDVEVLKGDEVYRIMQGLVFAHDEVTR